MNFPRAGFSERTAIALLLLLAGLVPGFIANAQTDPQEAASGTTSGTIRELSEEYVFVKPADDSPHRYYFKWAARGATPDPVLSKSLSALHAGDYVELHWSRKDRLELDSIAASAPPATLPAATEPAIVAVSETQAHASEPPPVPPPPAGNTAEKVNALVDNLLALGNRLLELPVFMLVAGGGVLAVVLGLLIGKLVKSGKRQGLARGLMIAELLLIFMLLAFLVDRKISRLEDEVRQMRSKSTADSLALLAAVNQHAASAPTATGRQTFLADPETARKALTPQFGDINLRPLIYDPATDIMQIRTSTPMAQAIVSIIDLRNPSVEIKLGTNLQFKSLTSQFAKDNDCTVAINGEAGQSPAPGSGLGPWRGHMVALGKVILMEDPAILRPFLSFDRQNHALFTSAALPNRAVAPDAYNVIWGRWDALLKGVPQNIDPGNRQPRTAMGINADGTQLYLLVVDGRQPRYSMGFTRGEVGQIMKSFGASDAMLCDEGGSSCMYLKQFGGIANVPSDNQGQERTTYTHFGIAMKK